MTLRMTISFLKRIMAVAVTTKIVKVTMVVIAVATKEIKVTDNHLHLHLLHHKVLVKTVEL